MGWKECHGVTVATFGKTSVKECERRGGRDGGRGGNCGWSLNLLTDSLVLLLLYVRHPALRQASTYNHSDRLASQKGKHQVMPRLSTPYVCVCVCVCVCVSILHSCVYVHPPFASWLNSPLQDNSLWPTIICQRAHDRLEDRGETLLIFTNTRGYKTEKRWRVNVGKAASEKGAKRKKQKSSLSPPKKKIKIKK